MTETEAKTKWCPMARTTWAKFKPDGGWSTSSDSRSFNRVQIESNGTQLSIGSCIGSACMMWREYGPPSMADQLYLMQEGKSAEEISKTFAEKYPDGRKGYCGLAAKP